ncbi:MAG: hypothetical protein DDT20_01476 [Firmicutes bacterium]|nr:hypothetical protein [Bacillota bacterium]
METILQSVIALVSVVTLIMVMLLLGRINTDRGRAELVAKLDLLDKKLEGTERSLREDFARSRTEVSENLRQSREELAKGLKESSDSLLKQLAEMTNVQARQLGSLTQSNELKLDSMRKAMEDKLTTLQSQLDKDALQNREELAKTLKTFEDSFRSNVREFNDIQKQKFDALNEQIEKLVRATEDKLTQMRDTLEKRLQTMQSDNETKLEKIRNTVEEKLHDALEKRLGESFALVSARLEEVHRGLGEMQTLATGVGDLKKALGNVKVRGVLGEVQLGGILEEILTPEQYEKNVAVKPSSDNRVEFAVKMPGKDEDVVWLPIDSKFPIEDYQRLLEAYEQADSDQVAAHAKQLEMSIKKCAKDIRDKYIVPPHTTDFAIMFLPFEGLHVEVLRITGLFEYLMRDYHVVVCGPTTVGAFLNSLRMGFRTLAIEKRSNAVQRLLEEVKTEFGKFGLALDKTKKKLQEASNTIDQASQRTRVIARKLKDVQELPGSSGDPALLGAGAIEAAAEEEEEDDA